LPYLNYATAVREGRLAEYEAQRVVSRGSYEERRSTRVEALKKELIRDNVFDPRKLDNVPWYYNIEEQNLFLDSITNGKTFGRSEYNYWSDLEPVMYFGQSLKRIQNQFNKAGMIPLILPKFSDLNNISVKEQQFLAMQGIGIGRDIDGRYGAGVTGTDRAFKNIEMYGGKEGQYYSHVEPTEYYISIGAVPSDMLREIEVHGAVSGTGFQRGAGYVGDEPEVTTDYIQPQITPSSTQKKPESVFQPAEPEPEVTTAHIEPPVEEPEVITAGIPSAYAESDEPDFNPPGWDKPYDYGTEEHREDEPHLFPTTSQVDPPGVEEPEVTTSQVEPPGVEEPEVTTSQVDPPVEQEPEPQEVTAQMSWFGDTWFPWHLSFDKRRR